MSNSLNTAVVKSSYYFRDFYLVVFVCIRLEYLDELAQKTHLIEEIKAGQCHIKPQHIATTPYAENSGRTLYSLGVQFPVGNLRRKNWQFINCVAGARHYESMTLLTDRLHIG